MSQSTPQSVAATADSFFDTWAIYRQIVSHNNMFHREIYADVARVLAEAADGFKILDLGCGDAANLAPVLAGLPMAYYHGVDLSQTALGLAETHLRSLACPVRLQAADLLKVLDGRIGQFDVIFSSFALHHLSTPDKADFFRAARRHLADNGQLLLIDTCRAADENLSAYLAAYCTWLRDDWQGINDAEKAQACAHIIDNDLPETVFTLQTLAAEAGFAACQMISHYRWHHVLQFIG